MIATFSTDKIRTITLESLFLVLIAKNNTPMDVKNISKSNICNCDDYTYKDNKNIRKLIINKKKYTKTLQSPLKQQVTF